MHQYYRDCKGNVHCFRKFNKKEELSFLSQQMSKVKNTLFCKLNSQYLCKYILIVKHEEKIYENLKISLILNKKKLIITLQI